MQITFAPTALPGQCFLCRSANREWFIDTLFSLDFEGAVFICNECYKEMAGLAKWISPEEYSSIKEDREHLLTENLKLESMIQELKNAVESLVAAGYNVYSDGSVSRSGGAPLEAPVATDEPVPVGENKLGKRKRTSAKQDNDEGVAELHSDASSDESEFKFDFE